MLPILKGSVQTAFARILSACLPHTCLLCACDSDDTLCPDCKSDLPRLPPGCPYCAEPTEDGRVCGRCLAHPPHFDATYAPLAYAYPVDRLIHTYKYSGELALAPWFAALMAESIGPAGFDCILPLPLHPLRLRERGFNQAAELARQLGKKLRFRVDLDSCRRRRATPPQAALPHKARADNVRGAFECTRRFDGERLLLVDDVLTTGATANECARTLKSHGAALVSVAVVARALRV